MYACACVSLCDSCASCEERAPADVQVGKFLVYKPGERITPFDALAHPFFDDLRKEGAVLPDGKRPAHIFDWTEQELQIMGEKDLTNKLYPAHARPKQ